MLNLMTPTANYDLNNLPQEVFNDFYGKVGRYLPLESFIRPIRPDVERKPPKDITVTERQLWNFDNQDHDWRSQFFGELPSYLANYFAKKYTKLFEKKGRRAANTYLREVVGKSIRQRYDLVKSQYKQYDNTALQSTLIISEFKRELDYLPTFDRAEIDKLSDRIAIHTHKVISSLLDSEEFKQQSENFALEPNNDASEIELSLYKTLSDEIKLIGFNIPYFDEYKNHRITSHQIAIALTRITTPDFWMKKLKRLRDQQKEHLSIAVGQVQNQASPYASYSCINEWFEQKRRNLEFIKSRNIENAETGEQIELALQVNKSNANPAIRRCELMVRMRGFEDLSEKMSYVGEFVTLTAPSKYHSAHSKGGFVDNWQGNSPRETQVYLCKVWSRIRASLKRKGIKTFGFRVAEPHHDGTPHWHLLLFIDPVNKDEFRQTFLKYALAEDGDESGALEHRATFEAIDPEKGSATGYIAKYISKNIDGYALDNEKDDETGQDLKKMAKAVTAWASRWKIRQFQQLGGAPVTVWRELRRLGDKKVEDKIIDPILAAADVSCWASYTELQGGATVARKDLKVRVYYEEKENQFEETVKKIKGVYAPLNGMSSSVCTRLIEWLIVLKNSRASDPWSIQFSIKERFSVPEKREVIETFQNHDQVVDEIIPEDEAQELSALEKFLKIVNDELP